MDELGSYPRMQYHPSKKSNYSQTQNLDQNGSWFSLAMSGLKWVMSNQSNNSIKLAINHNPTKHIPTTQSQNIPSNSKKLHILGPAGFKKQLYDIPEYQAMQIKGDKSNLTQQALKQFLESNNFSNYWNQRSSLHSHHSSDHGDMDSEAGSLTSLPNIAYRRESTDGGSTVQQQTIEEYKPSMTSSQIIHPTQEPKAKLKRSRSFPLLHSAEYIQNFEFMVMESESKSRENCESYEEEGSQCNFIPSPPAMSNTPPMHSSVLLPQIKNVKSVKSWESIKSTESVRSIKSVNSSARGSDGQWVSEMDGLPSNPKPMKSRKSYNMLHCNSMMVHVYNNSKSGSEFSQSPLPKSTKIGGKKRRKDSECSNEDEVAFSDWSNVSSNIGVLTPK